MRLAAVQCVPSYLLSATTRDLSAYNWDDGWMDGAVDARLAGCLADSGLCCVVPCRVQLYLSPYIWLYVSLANRSISIPVYVLAFLSFVPSANQSVCPSHSLIERTTHSLTHSLSDRLTD